MGVNQQLGRRRFLALSGMVGMCALSACTNTEKPVPRSSDATAASTPQGPAPRVVASGLDTPWSMVRRRDGSTLVSERDSALIKRIDPAGNVSTFTQVPGVVPDGEGGLLGLEILVAGNTEWLYAYLSTETDNRVVRFELPKNAGNTVVLDRSEVIIQGIAKASIHNGGRIKFGPDNLLYIGTGDASQRDLAQDAASLNGKILRVNPDGSIPASNPFTDSPVYSYGHRNVQGLAWDSTERLWATELGPDRDDEVNLIQPGANYGWPLVTGAPHREGLIDAAYVWESTADASPSGMTIIGNVAYIAALRGERLWRLELSTTDSSSGGMVSEARIVLAGQGRLRDVMSVSTNEILIATNEGADSRILALAI